eukprot:1142899-Pelagomonas_calceolata.AAC.5
MGHGSAQSLSRGVKVCAAARRTLDYESRLFLPYQPIQGKDDAAPQPRGPHLVTRMAAQCWHRDKGQHRLLLASSVDTAIITAIPCKLSGTKHVHQAIPGIPAAAAAAAAANGGMHYPAAIVAAATIGAPAASANGNMHFPSTVHINGTKAWPNAFVASTARIVHGCGIAVRLQAFTAARSVHGCGIAVCEAHMASCSAATLPACLQYGVWGAVAVLSRLEEWRSKRQEEISLQNGVWRSSGRGAMKWHLNKHSPFAK